MKELISFAEKVWGYGIVKLTVNLIQGLSSPPEPCSKTPKSSEDSGHPRHMDGPLKIGLQKFWAPSLGIWISEDGLQDVRTPRGRTDPAFRDLDL